MRVDIIGSLPTSNGFSYITTCVDRLRRWPVPKPLRDTSTKTVAKNIIQHYNFSVPYVITIDRSAQLKSCPFQQLTRLFGIICIRTTAYHPASNDIVQKFHQQLRAVLITMKTDDK
ncbi:unnamed protein product [Heterobilharzia americana]|nr:unnamed protein product [Heterobilharzia americana]